MSTRLAFSSNTVASSCPSGSALSPQQPNLSVNSYISANNAYLLDSRRWLILCPVLLLSHLIRPFVIMDLELSSHRLTPVLNTVEVDYKYDVSEWVLRSRVKPLLDAQTIGGVLDNLDSVAKAMSPFGAIQYKLDLQEAFQPGRPLKLLTTVKVLESRPTLPFSVSAVTSTDLCGLTGTGTFFNRFGLGESLDVSAAFQPEPYALGSGTAALKVPLLLPGASNALFSSKVYFFNQDRPWSSYKLASHGVSSQIDFPGEAVSASVGVEAVARHVHSVADAASDIVRSAAAGPATKASLFGTLTSGPVTLSGEVAGKPGDTSYTKVLATLSQARNLVAPLSGEIFGQFGYIDGKSSVLDNFVLGGPGSVYGFELNRMGPKDGKDFVGAQSFYRGRVSLESSLPWRPSSPLRLVGLLNGAAMQLNKGKTVADNCSELLKISPSLAAAAGISYKTPAAQFELLYLHPMHSSPGESVRSGIYLGLGLNFA